MSSSTTLQQGCIESSGGDNTLAIQCLASAMDTAAAGLDSTIDEVVFDINDLKGKSTKYNLMPLQTICHYALIYLFLHLHKLCIFQWALISSF